MTTSNWYVFFNWDIFAAAVASTLVSVLSKTKTSLTWYPFPEFETVIFVIWSADVALTLAIAPYPTLVESVIVRGSSISYPVPPSVIVTPVNWELIVAETTTPAAVVAVIVSPIVNKPTLSVITNSIIEIVPSFLSVTVDTKAVEPEDEPVIDKPLKFK